MHVTVADAAQLRAELDSIASRPERSHVVVIGGNYAGCELAAVVAERLGARASVEILTPTPTLLPGQSMAQVEAALRALVGKGVRVSTGACWSDRAMIER